MKIPEVYLKGKKDPGMIDFMDYTMVILNQGLYQMRTIDTAPNWIANEGEGLLYSNGGVRRVYYYIDGAWRYVQWGSGGGGTSLSLIADSDYDTYVDTETTSDEDVIHMFAGGVEIFTGGSTGITNLIISADSYITFDGPGGDTYWKYNSTTHYLECWVDAVKRMEV